MIRKMKLSDVNVVIDMGRAMHGESYFKFLDFSEAKLLALWDSINLFPNRMCGFVAEKDNKIIGIFVGAINEHWFGHDKVSCDLALYVTPEERGGSAAMRLVKAYERWAKEQGAREIHIGTATNVNPDRIRKLFSRLGYGDEAFFFRKRT